MKQTPTYYDLLGVSPYADLREISAAYLALSRAASAPDEATERRRQLLKQAFDVLTNPSRRADYDAGLALRAGGVPGGELPLHVEAALESTRWSPIRRLLTVIAALMVVGLTIQVSVMFVAYQRARATLGEEAASPAAEKAYLQDFYQTYGVRAASREEADLLLAEMRRKEEAVRHERLAQQQRDEDERKQKRFEEESRRIGAEVTANLQRAEQEALWAQQEEQRRKEEKDQADKAAERARLEREVNRWRSRPTPYGE